MKTLTRYHRHFAHLVLALAVAGLLANPSLVQAQKKGATQLMKVETTQDLQKLNPGDTIVMACPKFIAAHVVEGLEPERMKTIVDTEYRSYVVANALAFASAYLLGAWSVGFILVLALHHEIQYLSFTYAVARSGAADQDGVRFATSFAVWPLVGLATWALCKFSGVEWLVPLLVGGLLCHYWLDSRIWTARARRLARR